MNPLTGIKGGVSMNTQFRTSAVRLVLCFAVSALLVGACSSSSGGDVDFASGRIPSGWVWANGDPTSVSLTARPGWLRITTFGDEGEPVTPKTRNVLFREMPEGDFDFQVRLEPDVPGPDIGNLQCGVLFASGDKCLKLVLLRNQLEFTLCQNGRWVPSNTAHKGQKLATRTGAITLRLTRKTGSIAAYWRNSDSDEWQTLQSSFKDDWTANAGRIGIASYFPAAIQAPRYTDFSQLRFQHPTPAAEEAASTPAVTSTEARPAEQAKWGYFQIRFMALLLVATLCLCVAVPIVLYRRYRLRKSPGRSPVWATATMLLLLVAAAGAMGVAIGAAYYRQHTHRVVKAKQERAVARSKGVDALRARERERAQLLDKWRPRRAAGEIARIPNVVTPVDESDRRIDHIDIRLTREQLVALEEIDEQYQQKRRELENTTLGPRSQYNALSSNEKAERRQKYAEQMSLLLKESADKKRALLTPQQNRAYDGQVEYRDPRPILGLSWHPDNSNILICAGQTTSHGETFTQAANSAQGTLWGPGGGGGGFIFQWNVASGRRTGIIDLGHHRANAAYAATHLPDGNRIMSVGEKGDCFVWEIGSGKKLKTFTGHKWGIRSLALHKNGRLALTGGIDIDGTLQYLDIETSTQLRRFDGFSSGIYCLALSPDGRKAATAGDGVRVIDLEAGTVDHHLFAGEGRTLAVAWSPDGKRLAAGGRDNFIRVFDTSNLAAPPLAFAAHNGHVYCLTWSLDGTKIISGGFDHLVRIFDSGTGRLLRRLAGHTDLVKCLALSPNGKMLATGGFDGLTIVWDLESFREPEIRWLDSISEAVAAASTKKRDLLLLCSDGKAVSKYQGRIVDVTNQLAAKSVNGRFDVGRFNSLAGDPAPNVIKELRVEYEVDGRVNVVRINEHAKFTVPPPGEPGAARIIRAAYGVFPQNSKGLPTAHYATIEDMPPTSPFNDDRVRRLVNDRFVPVLLSSSRRADMIRLGIGVTPTVVVYDPSGNALTKLENEFTSEQLISLLSKRYDYPEVRERP